MAIGAQEVQTAIQEIVDEVLRQKGLPRRPLSIEAELLDGQLGLDSLDLAVIVTRLEEFTGRDPFKEGFRSFRTVGDLAVLYASAG